MTDRRIRSDDLEDVAAARIVEEGLDPITFRAMFGIFRLGGRMFNDLETQVHRPAGWSLAGFRVMFLVWIGGPMESYEIARLAGLSRAAISSAVVTVYLTDDGATRLEQAYRIQNQRERQLFSGLSEEELTTLTELMRRVSATRLHD
jgi:DNA-binding MarR family transcriptional regulator